MNKEEYQRKFYRFVAIIPSKFKTLSNQRWTNTEKMLFFYHSLSEIIS